MKLIRETTSADYLVLVEIWERAVRSSHAFLSEADIAEIREALIQQYFPNVNIYAIEIDRPIHAHGNGQDTPPQTGGHTIAGFIGLLDGKIEMLFIDSQYQGKGYGSALIDFAIREGVVAVDVNEQNPSALAFYLSKGFRIVSRDPTDESNRPFPILHLSHQQIS